MHILSPTHTCNSIATPPNKPPAEAGYAPTIILVLVLVINVIIGVLLVGLWIRRHKKQKRKRENFVVRMSELSDEFANEIQYESFKSAKSTSVSVTNRQQLSNSTHTSDTSDTIPSKLPQNPGANAERRKTKVPTIQIHNEKSTLTAPLLSQTERVLTINLKLSSNNAYGHKPIPSQVTRQPLDDSMNVQENMAYTDSTSSLPLATVPSQPGNYANRPTRIRQPIDYDYQYIEDYVPTQQASYTYIADGGDNNQETGDNNQETGDNNQETAGKISLAEHGPNYTYIDTVTRDQLRQIRPEHEYASIGEANGAASEGPEYAYIDNEAEDNGLDYYSGTGGGEGLDQSGDYYSTIAIHNN